MGVGEKKCHMYGAPKTCSKFLDTLPMDREGSRSPPLSLGGPWAWWKQCSGRLGHESSASVLLTGGHLIFGVLSYHVRYPADPKPPCCEEAQWSHLRKPWGGALFGSPRRPQPLYRDCPGTRSVSKETSMWFQPQMSPISPAEASDVRGRERPSLLGVLSEFLTRRMHACHTGGAVLYHFISGWFSLPHYRIGTGSFQL